MIGSLRIARRLADRITPRRASRRRAKRAARLSQDSLDDRRATYLWAWRTLGQPFMRAWRSRTHPAFPSLFTALVPSRGGGRLLRVRSRTAGWRRTAVGWLRPISTRRKRAI